MQPSSRLCLPEPSNLKQNDAIWYYLVKKSTQFPLLSAKHGENPENENKDDGSDDRGHFLE